MTTPPRSTFWLVCGGLAVAAWMTAVSAPPSNTMIILYSLLGLLLTGLGVLGGGFEMLHNLPLGIVARDHWRVRRWLGGVAMVGSAGVVAIGATQEALANDFNGIASAAAVIVVLLALAPMTRASNRRVMFVVMVGVVSVFLSGVKLLDLENLHGLAARGYASSILLSSLCLYVLAADVRKSRLTFVPMAETMAIAVATERSAAAR